MANKSLKIVQVKSGSKLTPKQKKILSALGLRGRGSEIYRSDLRSIRGMLNQMQHIVSAEQVNGPVKKGSDLKKKTASFTVRK